MGKITQILLMFNGIEKMEFQVGRCILITDVALTTITKKYQLFIDDFVPYLLLMLIVSVITKNTSSATHILIDVIIDVLIDFSKQSLWTLWLILLDWYRYINHV